MKIYCHLKGYCCGGKEEALFTFIPEEMAFEGMEIMLHGHRWYVDEVFTGRKLNKEIDDGTKKGG